MEYADKLSIKQWAEADRPREKLIIKGKAALSDAELIAILIGSGTKTQSAVELSRSILSQHNNDLNRLARLSLKDLQKFKGIGEAKAISIISALELGRRRKSTEPESKPKITGSSEVYEHLRPHLQDLDHEQFWVMYLNRSNMIIQTEQISVGGVAGTVVDSKVIFKKALEHLASSIILGHNHPSGNQKPSQQDIQLTKKMKAAGQTLDINVLDHLIFTDNGYFSFADESMM